MQNWRKNRMISAAHAETWRETNRPAVESILVIRSGIPATSKLMPKSASIAAARLTRALFCNVCCNRANISFLLPSWITAGISADMDLTQYSRGRKTQRVIRVQVRAAATHGLVLELNRL